MWRPVSVELNTLRVTHTIHQAFTPGPSLSPKRWSCKYLVQELGAKLYFHVPKPGSGPLSMIKRDLHNAPVP